MPEKYLFSCCTLMTMVRERNKTRSLPTTPQERAVAKLHQHAFWLGQY
jgi:hypothetical protein